MYVVCLWFSVRTLSPIAKGEEDDYGKDTDWNKFFHPDAGGPCGDAGGG
jgi:hypothetical protein